MENASDHGRCLRFVETVDFRVFNRWGREVYRYNSSQQLRSLYIHWDGNDLGGQPLPGGAYYYQARVGFNVIDPSKRLQLLKGWVKVVR